MGKIHPTVTQKRAIPQLTLSLSFSASYRTRDKLRPDLAAFSSGHFERLIVRLTARVSLILEPPPQFNAAKQFYFTEIVEIAQSSLKQK